MKKLKEQKGESLSEVLVASLIIALALILLVNMVTASTRLVSKSSDTFDENMTVKNSAEYGGSDGSAATTALPSTSGNLTISGGSITDSDNTFTWSGDVKSIGVTVLEEDDTSIAYTEN